ncbi:SirA-like domain-containing protein [Desulfotomaculum nigrificans CO-1-SRB]|uniref:SirA-like domain-containing protein n=1 Tax=Desulfotomaculum nigrificans (strain DSM 14880 / VKM B-2319 / CO-1-SRB) TaxID=868595 RepID=F6B8I8_DESCC|nr:sulfurtransferase TusA family protein [Desulfotomaculum nigrificans]AEF93560.1 SirA-like domain-containing protein [Desulfotomaculum nigrificans CO-1-SRB]
MAEYQVNARGLQCPGPIVQLFGTYKKCNSGDTIVIEVTEQGFKKDVYAWAKKTNCEILSMEEQDGVIKAVIKKN